MKQSEDDSVRYYIYVDENVSGPLVIEELAALVQQEKITADTLVACEGDEAYVPLRYSKLTPVLFPGLATNQPGTEGRPKLSRDDDVRYYTCIEESVGGPYTIEGLESLVYLKKITSDTYVAREGAEEYILLRDSELQPILFPGLLTTGQHPGCLGPSRPGERPGSNQPEALPHHHRQVRKCERQGRQPAQDRRV